MPEALGVTFNEGLGHGGTVITILGQPYIFDPFDVTTENTVIKMHNQYGVAIKKAGLLLDKDFTSTVQLPVDGGGNPIPLLHGTLFTESLTGQSWRIVGISISFSSGQVWKQNVTGTLSTA